MTDQRRVTPGNLARVALADVDDADSMIYWDASEPVATARTKRITIGDLRSAILSSPVVVGVDPDPMSAAVFRVGGDARVGGSAVIDDDADVGGDLVVGGSANIVGAVVAGSTTSFGGIVYTWPVGQTGNYFLRTDGAGALSWASPIGATGIDDLNDVTITAASAGQVLRWSGAAWVNSTDGSALTALAAGNLASGTVPNGRLTGAYTGVTGLGILTAALQFDDALYDIGSGGKRPRDFTMSRNAVIGGTLAVTGAVTGASFSGDGSLLTALSGTAVTTGTVAAARLATHDLISAHTAGGLTAGQVVRASAAATFAFAVLQFADLGGVPTTLAGFGITDAYTKTQSDAAYSVIGHVHSAADITSGTLSVTRGGTGVSNPTLGNLYLGAGAGAMTALAPGAAGGYVRSDGSAWARAAGVAFADLTGTPTTLAGYGITNAYTKTESDALYSAAGGSDTFTQVTISRAAANARTLRLATAGVARWDLVADSGAESGANAGSAFLITAYDDAGSQIDVPVTITRAAAGKITFARHIAGGVDATYDLGSGNRFRDLYLSRNAVVGGDVTVSGTLTVATITTSTITASTFTAGAISFTSISGGAATVSTLHATGAATLDSTLGVTGASTFSTVHATGAVTIDGNLDIGGGKFTVTAASGNTAITGTLSAAGTTVSTLHATGAVTLDAVLTIPNGGMGVTGFTAGDLPYYAAGVALSAVAIGTASKMLRSTGTAPAWSTATFPNTATAGDLMVATGANAWGSLAIGANKRVLQSDGSAAAWVANLDLGSGTFTAGASTVSTLHATGAVTMDSTATVAGITSSANLTANGAAATERGVRITTAGSLRWFAKGDNVAESGANAGTAWRLSAFDDAGVAIDDPIVVTRASGGTLFIQRPSNFTGNVEFGSDAAYDIGATNRPRDFRLSRNALIGGTLGVTGAVSLTVALTTANGGTGLASYAAGDMVYYAAGSLFSKLTIGANKTVMQSNGSIPVWSANLDIGTGTITAGAHTLTSSSATAFTIGQNGASNPVFTIDASTASQAAGVKITGAVSAGTVAFAVTSSGAAANLTVDAKGSGTIGIGTVSTGVISLGSVTITSGTAVDGVSTFHATGIATFGTDIKMASGGAFYVDGGTNTYANSPSAGVFRIVAGAAAMADFSSASAKIYGNLIAGTDASNDLGASGANRFRDFFLSRNATIGGTITTGGDVSIPNGSYFRAARNTGSANIQVLGFDSGTDNLFLRTGGATGGTKFEILNTTPTAIFSLTNAGALTLAGAVSGITTLSGSGAVSGFTSAIFSSTGAFGGTVTVTNPDQTAARFAISNTGTGGKAWALVAGHVNVDNTGFTLRNTTDGVDAIYFTSAGSWTTALGGTISSGGLTVSAGTTAVQALTATGLVINKSGATTGITLNSDGTTHEADVFYQQNGTDRWQMGMSSGSATPAFYIYSQGVGGNVAVFNYTTGAATFNAGISATTGTFSGGSHNSFSVSGTSEFVSVFTQSNASAAFGIEVSYSAYAPNGTANEFLYCVDNAAVRATIRSNGGLANFSANNVNLSDERVKVFGPELDGATITDAFRALAPTLFQYKDQTHDDWNIGFGARAVFAAFKQHAPDYLASVVDPNGWENDDGTSFYGLHETDLWHAHIAVTQHMIGRVDDLFADVEKIDAEFSEHELRILALESEVEHLTSELAALQPA